MKQCPACKTNYADDSQKFCLNDGAELVFPGGDDATIAFSPVTNRVNIPTNEPVRINIPPASDPTVFVRPQPAAENKGGKGLLIGGLIALVLLGIIGIAGVLGFLYFQNQNPGAPVSNANSLPKPNANVAVNTASPTPDETAAMKQKLANLEKQLQDQKNQKGSVPTLPGSPAEPKPAARIARANSPNDGFLALRTGPSSETGERILQIPHGAQLTVLACQPLVKGKRGRWCRVEYNGTLGWADDGWIRY